VLQAVVLLLPAGLLPGAEHGLLQPVLLPV
jgi:hypothetical protein